MGVDLSACARVAAALPAAASASCVSTSPALRFSASAAHASVSPLHSNSWSDTVPNSRCAGGLLPVCKSTSCTLEVSRQVPTGRRCTKGGVSGSTEDLRPVSEVEAGVNFRSAGGVWGQVAGSLPGRQPGTGTRQSKGRCGHTFPPSGGSWYPIRVTWIRIGHQAINGLDEGVFDRRVGDLGAKG